MFALFKSNTEKTIECLNKLTSPYTKYQWSSTQEGEDITKLGFYLSFPINSLAGDILHHHIQEAFETQSLNTSIVGNGLNAKNGTRLIIEANFISSEQIEKVKDFLNKAYGNINGVNP